MRIRGQKSPNLKSRTQIAMRFGQGRPPARACTDGHSAYTEEGAHDTKTALMVMQRPPVDSSSQAISGRWTQYGVHGLLATDVDVEQMCREVGLSYRDVSNPAAWIDHSLFVRLWSHAVRATGDPNLGLRAAERFEPVARDLLTHLLMSCKTVADGAARVTSFFGLAGELVGAMLIMRPAENVFRIAQRHPDHSAWAEFRLAAYWRFAEMAAQRRLPVLEVRFRHPDRGGSRDLYERVYGCPVKFSAIENCLVVPDETLAIPFPCASEETAKALEKAAEAAGLGLAGAEAQVRHLVRTRIPDGDHSETAIAHAMHMSERTLKRRLAEANCNFTQVVDDVRRRVALDLILTTSGSLEGIAHQVGYASPGSLVRAVKRWTDATPASLRSAQSDKRNA
jgi:AraC-like DNA-binding protein